MELFVFYCRFTLLVYSKTTFTKKKLIVGGSTADVSKFKFNKTNIWISEPNLPNISKIRKIFCKLYPKHNS